MRASLRTIHLRTVRQRPTAIHLQSDAAADQRDRLIQFRLAAPGDVDERAFLNEAFGSGEIYSAAAARRIRSSRPANSASISATRQGTPCARLR